MSAHSSLQRPPDELADLHIFVVPLELWLEKYRTAFNNIALESVSAGFVRVQPYISLNYLRDHIEEQLGPDVVPEDYVFLRSVGRCMAVVKENQERLLKAKDFLPPVSYTPEIFILPATHDSVARPVENAANTVIQTHGLTTAGMASMQPQQFPGIPAGYMQQPQASMLTGGYLPQQSGQVDQIGLHRRDVEAFNRKSRSNKSTSEDEGGSDIDRSQGERDRDPGDRRQSLEDRSGGSSENDGGDRAVLVEKKKKQKKGGYEEYEDAAEPVQSKTKKQRMQKKGSSSSSGSNQSEMKTVKFIQPEVYQSLPVPGQGALMVSPPTPIPSGRVIASPLPVQQADRSTSGPSGQEGSFDDPNTSSTSKAVEKGTVTDRKKKGDPKGGKKKRRERSRSPSLERTQSKEQEALKRGFQGIGEEHYEDENNSAVYGEVTVSRVETPPSLSEVEERSKFVQFPSPAKGAMRPVIHDEYEMEYDNHLADGSHDMDNAFAGDDDLPSHDQDIEGQGLVGNENMNNHTAADNGDADDEGNVKETSLNEDEKAGKDGIKRGVRESTKKDGTKSKPAGNAAKGKKVVKKPVKKPTESLEDKFKLPEIPKVPTPPPVMHQKRRDKELGEDTASAKDRKRQEIEDLKAELRKAKNARVDMEKEREMKVRRAKMLQNQMMQKRNQSKNIWKKKFFDEKRKTATLDDQVNKLRHEVEVQHKILMSFLETKEHEGNKPQGGGTFKSPSEKTNQRMSLVRLQNEVEELRIRIEELKMKLTAEMKNRDTAQKELKQIRQDLMEKKINLTLTKSQKSLATLANPENIAV